MSYTHEVTYEGYNHGLQFGGYTKVQLDEKLPPSLGLGKIRKYLIKHGVKVDGFNADQIYLTSWES